MASLATIYARGGAPFTVNSEYSQKFQDFLNDPEWGDYSFDPKTSGGYNYRNIAGTNTLSQHAHGNAIDINWLANARGTPGNIDPDLARRLAQKHGLTWGGDWRNPDPMHFEIAGVGGPKTAPTAGPTLASTLAQGGNKMPDPVTGEYTPEEIIAARRRQSGLYQAEAVPGGKWGPLAGLLQGFGAGVTGNQADTYSRSNQSLQQAAAKRAAAATTQQEFISALAGTPAYSDTAVKMAGANLDPMRELDIRLKKAQIAQAEQKDALEQFLLNEAGGPARAPGVTPTAPAGSPAPAPVSPPAGIPGVSAVPPVASPRPAPAATAPAPQSARELLASRTPAERLAFLMAYKKDPGEAAKMLQGWADPNKEQEKARQNEFGQAQAKAQASLPGAMVSTDRMLQKIDDVLNEPDPKNPGKYLPDPRNPGQFMPNQTLPGVTGPLQGKLPTFMGKKRDMEEELKQIQGGVFMEAYQALKGGGAISDAEGKPATQAIARLAALDQSDKGYRKALIEARGEILKLRQLAQDRAAGKIPMPTQAAPAAPVTTGSVAPPAIQTGNNPAANAAFIQEASTVGIPPEIAVTIKEGGRVRDPSSGKSFVRVNGKLVDEAAVKAQENAEGAARYAPQVPSPLSNFDASGQFTGSR